MPGKPRHGWFVSLEGPEGSGKTTHARAIADAGRAAGLDVVLAREPGGTPIGEAIRTILLDSRAAEVDPRAEALLFNAARAELVADVIAPALRRGALVVCARFADSTAAYQGHGRGLEVGALREVERFATGGLRPDLTVLLDLPVTVGLARKTADEGTRFEALDRAFHERVRAGFLALARLEPDRFAIVDASAGLHEVRVAVLDALARLPGLEGLARAGTVIPDPSSRA